MEESHLFIQTNKRSTRANRGRSAAKKPNVEDREGVKEGPTSPEQTHNQVQEENQQQPETENLTNKRSQSLKRAITSSKKAGQATRMTNKEALSSAIVNKREELQQYAFNRIKHPKLGAINEHSLRKCLNDFDIKIPGTGNDSDYVIKEMIKVANSYLEHGSDQVNSEGEDTWKDRQEQSLVSSEAFKEMFDKGIKFKFDADGRIL